ncbi:hypothetical protein NM688_g6901 [Phlebia brevispora]|uniref:Uncharacterized protein n=1 Tax=Phlebia brevispora TaxID=194682 RepID=A0ACC1SBL5_9APHY|nr:hypothetical protein NM688_g6901 [Phlebia brevispora]
MSPDDSHSRTRVVLPASILDTDLYKFTMQQAVLQHFPDVDAIYQFTHRDPDVYFTRECFDLFVESVKHFGELALTEEERQWLPTGCPYFTQDYVDYLAQYRFKPEQVKATFHEKPGDSNLGRLHIQAIGPWRDTILWEVPLMSTLSEIYFNTADTDWSYNGQEEQAYEKGKIYLTTGCVFSEFGTRRRRSFHTQDLVMKGLVRASHDFPNTGKLMGTSNVHLALKYNVPPIGTIAQRLSEWYMGIGALRGYEHANSISLDLWEKTYPNDLHIALTDTFSTEAFYKDFVQDKTRAQRWSGLRQDSGDPMVFAPRAKEVYDSLGINYHEKIIIYSDAINVEKALKIYKQCTEVGFKCSFGIGTSLTNDFKKLSSGGKEKSKALNMVIKLAGVDGKHCVKISDELTKNTGDPQTVKLVKNIFNINV